MSETRNIVILGASYAGLGATHYFLKHVYPHLPTHGKVTYKVILVDPSSRWFCRVAAPRAVSSGKLMPDEKIFHDTKAGFAAYGNIFGFILGKATSWDADRRTVTITKDNGDIEELPYHALILATGARAGSPLFSLQGNSMEEVRNALHEARAQVSQAKRVVVVGGGPTGVETAGEMSELRNGRPGWFASRPADIQTHVTLITTSSQLLPALRESLGQKAEMYLNQQGADVRYNTKVVSAEKLPNGQTKVTLHNGEEIVADMYIEAVGYTPNTDYAPRHLVNAKGYIKMNDETLRVDLAGPRVYAIGDVGTYSRDRIPDILYGIPVMETNLKRDLLAAHDNLNAKPADPDRRFKPVTTKEFQFVTLGQTKGVGAMFGWKLPSFAIWLLKGRDYWTGQAPDTLVGKDWLKEVEWKK